jgi:hypothetical protein
VSFAYGYRRCAQECASGTGMGLAPSILCKLLLDCSFEPHIPPGNLFLCMSVVRTASCIGRSNYYVHIFKRAEWIIDANFVHCSPFICLEHILSYSAKLVYDNKVFKCSRLIPAI